MRRMSPGLKACPLSVLYEDGTVTFMLPQGAVKTIDFTKPIILEFDGESTESAYGFAHFTIVVFPMAVSPANTLVYFKNVSYKDSAHHYATATNVAALDLYSDPSDPMSFYIGASKTKVDGGTIENAKITFSEVSKPEYWIPMMIDY